MHKLHLAGWLDAALFRLAQFRNRKINTVYCKQNPGIILPADYPLYETYQLNYRKFIEDGRLAAMEITEWTKPYISEKHPCLLDWGCGVGRTIQHVELLPPGAVLYGCDINDEMIEWNKNNYPQIAFTTINNFPPTPYAPFFFDLVYGMSIFTHIESRLQIEWIIELYRILKSNGVLLITTQGAHYYNKLLPGEMKVLDDKGVYTQNYYKQGHRMMSTYNKAETFKTLFEPYFTLLEYHNGKKDPGKIGGQDLWIFQKREE